MFIQHKRLAKNTEYKLTYKPIILNLTMEADRARFEALRTTAEIVDEIKSQLEELMKARHPKLKLNRETSEQFVREHLNGASLFEYGLWIYYPWLNKLVHTLTMEEFIQLRTNRNCYKIMPDEQQALEQKSIGIVGLSVGHAIAVTIASERICGELRLADFDTLELTNLNWIKTGIQNLGINKSVLAAREIAEIDPFLKVICYEDGITDDNVSDFLLGTKKLDLCIEECDGFYTKFNLRYKCKEYGIPVVMDTSDKGLIDIERFDLEPEREIFHGLTHVEDINVLRGLTTDEKIPYLYQIINEEAMSTRLKASLIEIDESITSWPQLSSAVSLGSGITTDVARRILLGELNHSGRFSLDPDDLITDQHQPIKSSEKIEAVVTPDVPVQIHVRGDGSGKAVERNLVESMVADAIKAPSGGNSQPWKWIYTSGSLFLILDTARCSPYTDVNNWGAVLALGCATENLALSAHKHGFGLKKEFLDPSEYDFALKFTFTELNHPDAEPVFDSGLAGVIDLRQTNRNNAPFRKLEDDHRNALYRAVNSVDGAQLTLIDNKQDIARLTECFAEGDIIRFLNKFLFNELMDEIRWNKKEAVERPYGVELDLFDISQKDKIGFRIAGSWSVASFVKKIGGNALGDLSRKLLGTSSCVAMITMPELTKRDFYHGGIAVERFWLTTAKHNIAVHPFAALSYFFNRVDAGETDIFSQAEIQKLHSLRKTWDEVLHIPEGTAQLFFAKLSYAERADVSQRIPLHQVLTFEG